MRGFISTNKIILWFILFIAGTAYMLPAKAQQITGVSSFNYPGHLIGISWDSVSDANEYSATVIRTNTGQQLFVVTAQNTGTGERVRLADFNPDQIDSQQVSSSDPHLFLGPIEYGVEYTVRLAATRLDGTVSGGVEFEVIPRLWPGPPTALSAVVNDAENRIEFSWEPPTELRGSVLTGYDVQFRPTDRNVSAPGNTCHHGLGLNTLTCQVVNARPGRKYTFTVWPNATIYGRPTDGDSASTEVVFVDRPSSPLLTAEVSGGQVELSWSEPSFEVGRSRSGYRVSVTTSDGSPVELGSSCAGVLTNSVAAGCTLSGLSGPEIYTVALAAVYGAVVGERSVVSAEILSTPETPTSVLVEARDQRITVRWDAAVLVEEYVITATPVPSGSPVMVTVAAPTRHGNVTGLTNGTEYMIEVVARNSAGDSDPSSPSLSATPLALASPSLISFLIVDGSGGHFNTIFGHSLNVIFEPFGIPRPDRFRILLDGNVVVSFSCGESYRMEFGAFCTVTDLTKAPGAEVGCVSGRRSKFDVLPINCRIGGLVADQEYMVAVEGITMTGELIEFTPQGSGTPAPATGFPNHLGILVSPVPIEFEVVDTGQMGAVVLTWVAPPLSTGLTLVGYRVMVDGEEATTGCQDLDATASSCTLTIPTTDTYVFTVVAIYDQHGAGSPATITQLARYEYTAPAPPGNFNAIVGNSQINLSWSLPEDDGGRPVTGYTVTTTPAVDLGECANLDSSATECRLTELTNGTRYTLQLVATNDIGSSTPLSLTETPLQEAPVFESDNRLGSVTYPHHLLGITWDPILFVDSYMVTLIETSSGNEVTKFTAQNTGTGERVRLADFNIDQINSQQVSPEDPHLFLGPIEYGVEYTVRLVARNSAGPSNVAEFEATPRLWPGPPTALSAVVNDAENRIEFSWEPPTELRGSVLTGYDVQFRPTDRNVSAPGNTCHHGLGLNTLTCQVVNARPGRKYTFTVRPTAAIRGGSTFGDSASTEVVFVDRPSPPLLTAEVSGGQVELSWSEPSFEVGRSRSGYRVSVTTSDGSPVELGSSCAGVLTNSVAAGCTLSGLSGPEIYTIALAAVYGAVVGERSVVSAEILSTPETPTSVLVEAKDRMITVRWDAAVLVEEYVITATPVPSGSPVMVTVAAPTRHGNVTGLTNGTEYMIEVVARNSAGDSDPSSPSLATPLEFTQAGIVGLSVYPAPNKLVAVFEPFNIVYLDKFQILLDGDVVASFTCGSSFYLATAPFCTVTDFTKAPGAEVVCISGRSNLGGLPIRCDISGLVADQEYMVAVEAFTTISGGLIEFTSQASGTTTGALGNTAPGDFEVLEADQTGEVALSWTPPPSNGLVLVGYRVLVNEEEATTGCLDLDATVSSCTLIVPASGVYVFTVAAIYDEGTVGEEMATVSQLITLDGVATRPQAAPVLAPLEPGVAELTARWSTVLDASGYRVTTSRLDEGSASPIISFVNAPSTSVNIRGLLTGVEYEVVVEATNDFGEGPISNTQTTTTWTATEAPRFFTAVPGTMFGEIDLSWSGPVSNQEVSTFQISVGGVPVDTGSCASANLATDNSRGNHSCTLAGIDSTDDQVILVQAGNSEGFGISSEATSMANLQPSVPSNFTVVSGLNEATLSWESEPAQLFAISGYEVVLVPAVSNSGCDNLVGTDITGCTLQGLDSDQTYTVSVRAIGVVTNSDTAVMTGVRSTARPSAPDLMAIASETIPGRIDLTWSAPSDENAALTRNGYRVTHAPFEGTGCTSLAADATSCALTGLTNAQDYDIVLSAIYTSSGISETAEATVRTFSAPLEAPTVTFQPGGREITVSWTEVEFARNYEIEVDSVVSLTVSAPTTSSTLTGLTNRQEYAIRVRALNSFGSGPFSEEQSAAPAERPSAPIPNDPVSRIGEVNISWSEPADDGGSDITDYIVAVDGTVTTCGQAATRDPTSTTCIFNIAAGTYEISIRAINALGSSDPATFMVTALPIPSAPRDFAGVASETEKGRIRFTWRAPQEEHGFTRTGYQLVSGTNIGDGCDNLAPTATECVLTNLPSTIDFFGTGDHSSFVIEATYDEGAGSQAEQEVQYIVDAELPGNIVTEARLGQIALSWSAPTNDGGTPIVGYRVSLDGSDLGSGPCADLLADDTGCTIDELDPGLYSVSLRAYTIAGDGVALAPRMLNVPSRPSAPRRFVANITDRQGAVTLRWVVPTTEFGLSRLGYRVSVDGVDVTTGTCASLERTNRTCRVTGLDNGRTYTFRIVATYAEGDGTPAEVSQTTLPGVPGVPQIAVAAGDGEIVVSWPPPVPGADTYEIHSILARFAILASQGIAPVIGTGGAVVNNVNDPLTTFTITGLENGEEYLVQMVARNDDGRGEFSPIMRATPRSVPGVPTAFGVTPGINQAQLSWGVPLDNGGEDILGYEVTVTIVNPSGTPLGSGEGVGCANLSGAARDCVISGLVTGRTYQLDLAARNSAGTGPLVSRQIVVRTGAEAPTSFNAVASSSLAGQIDLSWGPPPAASEAGLTRTGYQVRIRRAGVTIDISATNCAVLSRNATSCSITGLENNQAYDIEINASYSEGSGATAILSGITTSDGRPRVAPTVTLTPDNSMITVNWDAVELAQNYVISVTGSGYREDPITVSVTRQTITGLNNGTEYTIRVAARNTFGDGPQSAPRLATPRTVPDAPTITTATFDNGQIELSWTPPADNGGAPITQYTITVNPPAASGSPITVSAPATTRVITGLVNGTPYTFAVSATNAAGAGVVSATRTATPRTVPSAPTLTAISGSSFGEIDLLWIEPDTGGDPITEYEIAVNGAVVTTGTCANVAHSRRVCTVVGIDSLGDQTIAIRARNAVGLGAAGEATARANLQPDAPQNFQVAPEIEQLSLSWVTDPAQLFAITGYVVVLTPAVPGSGCDGLDDNSDTGCTLRGLDSDATYTVQVRAVGTVADSVFATRTGQTPIARPSAPVLTVVESETTQGQITLTWIAPADEDVSLTRTGYRILVDGSAPGGGTCANTLGADENDCTITGLPGGPAEISIFATYEQGDGVSATETDTVEVSLGAPTAEPTVRLSRGVGSIFVSWMEVARAEEYIITVVPVDASGSPLTVSAPTTELFITGLTNGREYTIQVQGSNTFGPGPLSAAVRETPRTTPGGPSLNPLDVSGSRPGDGRIALIWTAPADNGGAAITGYEVKVTAGGSTVTPTGCTLLDARARSCTLTGLTNGERHEVRIQAVNEAGSGVITGRSATPMSIPGAVTSLTAIVGIEQIRLTWDPPADGGGSPITEYQVTIDNAAELDGCEGPLDGIARSCTVTGLNSAVSYTLEVIAINAIGEGLTARVTERPAAQPGAPSDFRAVVSPSELGRVDLSWGPPISGEDGLTRAGYRVLIDDLPAVGTCATDSLNADSSGCVITNLTAGESYTITLVATYTEGNVGSQSATAQVTLPAGVPAATPTVTLEPGDRTITVSWTEVPGAGEYIITVVPVDASGSPLTVAALTTELVISGLNNGREYTIQVQGSNTFGPGPLSAAVRATPRTRPGTPDLGPLDISASLPGDGRIVVSWTAPTDDGGVPITGYVVMVITNNEDVTATTTGCASLEATTTTCTLTGLTNGQMYSIRIRAVNEAGLQSMATGRRATPVSRPGAVATLTPVIGIGQIRLTWDAPADNGGSPITEYQVTIDNAADLDGCAGPLDGIARSCTVTGLNSAVSYTLEVTAINAIGEGLTARVTERPAAQPEAPVGFSAEASASVTGQIDLSWGPPANEDAGLNRSGYRILIDGAAPTAGTCAAPPGPAATSCSITGLTGGQTYDISMLATYTEGEGVSATTATDRVDLPIGAPPTAPTVILEFGDQMITVSWTAVPAADNYIITVAPADASGSPITVLAPTTTHDVRGLTNGTEYTIQVETTNSFGLGPPSTPARATPSTVPGVPTIDGVDISGSRPGDGRIALSWTAPTETGGAAITGYEVTVSAGGGSITPTGCTPLAADATSCTLTGLTNGTAYEVSLAAVNAAGSGTAATTTATPRSIPGAVANIAANVEIERIRLTWDAPADNGGSPITGYQVTIDNEAELDGCAGPLDGTTGECTVTGLDSTVEYTLEVVAVNAMNGAGDATMVAGRPAAQPGAPAGFRAIPSTSQTGQIDLSWRPPANEDGRLSREGYRVLIDDSVPTAGTCSATQGPAASGCTITGLTGVPPYEISILATYGDQGEGATFMATVDAPQEAPTITASRVLDQEIFVRWSPVEDAADYIISVNPVDGSGSPITVSAPTSFVIITGLTNGREYAIEIYASNGLGNGPSSAPFSATPSDIPDPPTITGTDIAGSRPGNGQIVVSWTAPTDDGGSDIEGYMVLLERNGVGESPTGCTSLGPDATSCTLTGLINGQEYLVRVQAQNAAGLGGSDNAIATPLSRPGVPTNLRATANTPIETMLTWTAPTDNGGEDITSYILTTTEVTTDTFTQREISIADCSDGLCSGTLRVFPRERYDVEVAAVNSRGEGEASTLSSPGTPTNLRVTTGDALGELDLTWTVPSDNGGTDITSYRLERIIGPGNIINFANVPSDGNCDAAACAFTVTGLDDGVTYVVHVAAINSLGTGEDSSSAQGETLARLSGLTATASPTVAGRIDLTWNAPAATVAGSTLSGYRVTVDGVEVSGGADGTCATADLGAASSGTVSCMLTNFARKSGGDTYRIEVGALYTDSEGGMRVLTSDATSTDTFAAPGMPILIETVVTGASSDNVQIALRWDPPTDNGGLAISEYVVTLTEEGSPITPTGCTSLGTTTTCTLTGLSNGQRYLVGVQATNSIGPGLRLEIDETPRPFPSVVRNLMADIDGYGQIALTWDEPEFSGGSPITEYLVSIDPRASLGGCTAPLDPGTRGCTVSGLDSTVDYTFRIYARNAAGFSFADEVNESPAAQPGVPFGFIAVVSTSVPGQIDLSWGPPANEDARLSRTGYRVMIDGAAPTAGTCAAALGIGATGCTITGLAAGNYNVTIVATYAEGDGVTGTDDVNVPLGPPSTAPTVNLEPGDRTITVSWEELPAASEYIITVAPAASSGSPITVSAPDTSFEVLGLTNGTAYTIQVGGSNSFGDGPQSAPMRETPVAAPGAPTITADVTGSLPGDGQIALSWTMPNAMGSAITGYEVTVTAGGSTETPTGCTSLVATATSCTLTGLTNGTAYAISLVARNAEGPSTAATTTATPRSIPGAVTSLTSIVDGIERIELTWGPPTDNSGSPITGYQVTIDNSANLDGCAGTLGPAARECTVAGLDSAVEYTLEVVAINAVGDGIADSVSETPAARPGAPAGFSAIPSTSQMGQIDLSWGPPTNEDARLSRTGYRVMIDGAAPTSGTCAAALGTGATGCTITGLAAGNYDVTIVATYADGDGATGTDDVNVPRGRPEMAPTVTLVPGDGMITASWTEVPEAAEYIITVDPVDSSGSPITVSAANTSNVISGLTNRQSYDIRVRGANSFGAGPQSAVRMASPGSAPRAAPTIADVDVSTIRNIVIDWDTLPPSDDGGSPITNYEAIATPAPGEGAETVMCVVNAPTTSCTLEEGVFAGIVYEVQVRAINSFGAGDYSAAMTVTTPTAAPDMPRNIVITEGSETLSVAWDFVIDDGGSPITGYIVRVALEDAPGTIVAECETAADINTCALEELDNDENYIVTVFAVSDEGVSVASAAVRASPGTAIIESSSDYLADFAQNLAAQIVNIVGDHIDSASSAGDSFVSLGGKTLSFEQWAADTADRPIGWGEHQTVEEMLKGNPISFGFHGGGGGSKSGSYTLWGYVGIQGFEGKTGDGQTDFSGDLLTRTLGIDYHLDDGTIGVGVSYSDDEGKLGADKTDVELLSVHPYISWELSESTSFVGQFGLGEGNLKVIDADGNVDQDEDFQLQFVSLGLDNDLNTGWFEDIELGLRTDAQVVQIDADNRELDSDVWRLRAAIEAHSVFDLTGGGTARPSLEFGVRYDGGDTQTGLGLDTVLGLRMDNPASGVSLEGKARYLLAHRESSKREWSVGMVLSYDIGTKERGLAFSLEPSYGGGASQSRSIWLDKFTVSDQERRMRLRATLGYGMGVLGGAAVMTPYGSYELSDSDTRKLREGLLFAWPAHKTSLDLYLEQSLRDEERNENSVNIKFALDF